jgi:hypothetical protein
VTIGVCAAHAVPGIADDREENSSETFHIFARYIRLMKKP